MTTPIAKPMETEGFIPLVTAIQKDKEKKLNDLIEAHWKYIAEILSTAGMNDTLLYQIGVHYRTAFAHGYKHGMEDSDKNFLNVPY